MGEQKTVFLRNPKPVASWAIALSEMSRDIPSSWDPIQRFFDYHCKMPESIGNTFSLTNSASKPVSSAKS